MRGQYAHIQAVLALVAVLVFLLFKYMVAVTYVEAWQHIDMIPG